MNRRAFVDTILRSLECHMDVQCADGKDMLLRYTTSYVSKIKHHDVLYDTILKDFSGYDIGNRYMGALDVNFPEMVMLLIDVKVAYCSAVTKRFVVPRIETVSRNKAVLAYLERSRHEEGLSLLGS